MSRSPGARHSTLRVNYLLEDTALFGGVKVVLQQANLLSDRGHAVTVASRAERPDWMPVRADFLRVAGFSASELPAADVTVATYWTTLEPALAADRGQVLHYCQGFEWTYTHNRGEHGAIHRAYAHPLPAMVVSRHLIAPLRERFGRVARWVPQPLEAGWRPRRFRLRPGRPPRILVCGPFENDWKGVATALEAVARMRRELGPCRLIRLSQWPQPAAEREVLPADEFHHALRPARARGLFRGCDLLLAPSWEQEAFGLPVLEAMASGVPVVASDIECFREYAAGAATLVPFDRPEEFARAASDLLSRPRRWRRQRRAGLEASRAFSEKISAQAAEEALRWAASGTWRREAEPSGAAGAATLAAADEGE